MKHVENTVWQSVLQSIDTLPETSTVPRLLYTYLQRNLVRRNLKISLNGNMVSFNRRNLDLSKRKKICKIFEAFLHQEHFQLSRNSLVKQVYSSSPQEQSKRQQTCYNHNVVKLISRARRLAAKTFREEGISKMYWFPYDPCSQTWRLYSIRACEKIT